MQQQGHKRKQLLTGSSWTVTGLRGTLQRPNSWESTLISRCFGETTFTCGATHTDGLKQNEWNEGKTSRSILAFNQITAHLKTVGQHRAKRRERREAHCGATGAETTILMLLVGVLVRVLKVQVLLSSVRPQDLALRVIWPRGLRRVTPGAKV